MDDLLILPDQSFPLATNCSLLSDGDSRCTGGSLIPSWPGMGPPGQPVCDWPVLEHLAEFQLCHNRLVMHYMEQLSRVDYTS